MVNWLKYFIIILVFSIISITNFYNIKDSLIRIFSTLLSYEDNIHKINNCVIHKYETEIELIKSTDYLFIGDSHFTHLFSQISCPNNWFNISISGETTEGLLRRFNINIIDLQFENAVILLGYNDLKYRSVSETAQNYKKIISQLNCDNIYVICLLPVYYKRSSINKKINLINCFLESYCQTNEKYHFINISNHFLSRSKNGIIKELSTDGTHLNLRGNKILYKAILKRIEN